ncbi:hypothetical protein [Bacillus cereus group sp. BfR-BA-01347]|uniref:hypothetical protein n=1 Tax=Bacillus cereus group sp. BfR-BA-01347 TaxID=2920310 RepID=UPI001F57FA73|nr:hypothetical protein [Bacillus cereus group sp. BfR-BA-01347]
MKTIKILGMGEVEAEKNGVSREEYYKALANVSNWHGLAPYKVDEAIGVMKKSLHTCPKCNAFLHETNTDGRAPRTDTNKLLPFEQGGYCCQECVKKKDLRYFEFTKHEYYALVVIKEKNEVAALEKSFELYVKVVAGDSVRQIKKEGFPVEIAHEQAWAKYIKNHGKSEVKEKTHELYKRFYDCENEVLLIDGCLG